MKRLGLVRLSAMGDVVQSLGAASALQRARPELEIHFVTQRGFEPLLEGLGFASVIGHDRSAGLRGWRRTRSVLVALRLDAVVDLQGNWKSAVACRLSGASVRIGAVGAHRRESSSRLLINRRIAMAGPVHPAWIALRLLNEVATGLEVQPAPLRATEAEVAAAGASVRTAGLDPSRPFSVLIVSTPADVRSWPPAAMQRQAGAEPFPTLWLRGPDEAGVAVPAGVPTIQHGPNSLRELVGLGVLVARVGGRVLGPDQGPVHVLNGCGADTTVLFGPQDPNQTAPPGARVVTKRDGPSCAPCRRRRCSHLDGPVCMEFTTLE